MFTALLSMRRSMSQKRSNPPSPRDLEKGWYTKDAKDIAKTFATHGRLLLLLTKLEIIPQRYYHILCRDFQAKTFEKIRDGE